MNATEVENLVREVLRQLTAVSSAAPGSTAVASPKPPVETPRTAPIPSGTAVVRDSLVTLASIEDRLTGITRMVVSSRAIVTPAVVDELRKRGISIVRSADAIAGTTLANLGRELVVTLASDGLAALRTDLVSVLRRTIPQLELIDNCRSPKLEDVLAELTSRVVSRGRVGLLLTSTTAVAAALANRTRGVRALVATSGQSIDDAADTLAPNLIVVDRLKVNVWQLRAIASRLVSHGVMPPAAPWNQLL